MKIVESADWRSSIPFDTPVLVADLIPGEPTRCAACGADSESFDRTELWAYKHQHPNNHSGYVRFYCREHVPAPARPAPVESKPARRAPRRESVPRTGPRPASADPDPTRALCPDCFVEVSATGVCGMCGTRVS
ncbi:hypothetical protein GCM10009775_29620 [Microbacterium aoyamense]|uniref:Glucose-6-phosphate dehydrogenase n=1 Tax=Microbacterium aoyamense TaxID=344166 RepID=A0ABN2PXA1_9MICO|nr:glucose-6-phosphate dehydrogenase [Microbacterium aoyamense]